MDKRPHLQSATAAIALYSVANWLEVMETYGEKEYDAFNHGQMVNGIGFAFGDLLPRPHNHLWPARTDNEVAKMADDIFDVYTLLRL
ncbi:hypothetical protein, partial [Kineococcus sp. NPDC059986]|uniref:hypothetical protein n=1 Tax=Kineococcus sp. NPDC059986 TaxID=3155538 RepID=UPI00344D4AFD